jgi:hypothetical protein
VMFAIFQFLDEDRPEALAGQRLHATVSSTGSNHGSTRL